MKNVTRRTMTVSVLTTAMGIALAAAAPSRAAETMDMSKMPKVVQDNMARMMSQKLQKCYGVNAAAKNDCAEGAHSCAGQGTARDAKSFVLLPAGDCEKIAGGKLAAG